MFEDPVQYRLFLKSLQINAYNLKGCRRPVRRPEDQTYRRPVYQTEFSFVPNMRQLVIFFTINKFYRCDKGIIKYICNCNSKKANLMNLISQGVVCGWIFRCVTRYKFQMNANLEMITWSSTHTQPMCGFSGSSKGSDSL